MFASRLVVVAFVVASLLASASAISCWSGYGEFSNKSRWVQTNCSNLGNGADKCITYQPPNQAKAHSCMTSTECGFMEADPNTYGPPDLPILLFPNFSFQLIYIYIY